MYFFPNVNMNSKKMTRNNNNVHNNMNNNIDNNIDDNINNNNNVNTNNIDQDKDEVLGKYLDQSECYL